MVPPGLGQERSSWPKTHFPNNDGDIITNSPLLPCSLQFPLEPGQYFVVHLPPKCSHHIFRDYKVEVHKIQELKTPVLIDYLHVKNMKSSCILAC